MLRKNGTGKHLIARFLDGSSKAFTDGNRLRTGEDNFWIRQSCFRGTTIHGIVSHSRHGATRRNFCGFAESGSSHDRTKSDQDPRGSLGNQKPYAEIMA